MRIILTPPLDDDANLLVAAVFQFQSVLSQTVAFPIEKEYEYDSVRLQPALRTYHPVLGLNRRCCTCLVMAHCRHHLSPRMEIHDAHHVRSPVPFSLSFLLNLRADRDSVMSCRIPVYIINALYLWPITIWTYVQYGRPGPLRKEMGSAEDAVTPAEGETAPLLRSCQGTDRSGGNATAEGSIARRGVPAGPSSGPQESNSQDAERGEVHQHHDNMNASRSIFASITIATCHCGAGCVLGDIIGEWLVYQSGATVGGSMLNAAFIVGKCANITLSG